MDTTEELKKIEELMRRSSSTGRSPTKSTAQAAEKSASETTTLEPIAIVGVAGMFPKCASVADFWLSLQNDDSLIEEMGAERFDWGNLLRGNDTDELASQCRWAGLIGRPYGFDAEFFSIPAREAELMDPRLRLLLMSIYHCLEDAGYAPEGFKKSATGLFIGAEDSEYGQSLHELGIDLGLANTPSMLANRIAYLFDFAGPSELINTMCSSGAVALHRACNALRAGEISQAVVGAANVMVRPEPFLQLAEMDQLSSEATVFSFGRKASGYLRADGVGSVLLKTLSQAKRDGDAIYALIKHSAVNFNGQGGISMAAPNIAAHVNLIKKCYREAGVDPREIDYIEAQGMGTPVSDIAEWHAFNRALVDLAKERKVGLNDGNCRISTVKPVMGHMHAASVFGALFKVILSLQKNTIYKIKNFSDVSADLDDQNQPCRLLQEDAPWLPKKTARLAGIHSYGIGGNNAHLLVEEYVAASVRSDASREQVHAIPFSARSPHQLRTLIQQYHRFLKVAENLSLSSLAYTLQVGRDAFEHRAVFLASSRDELIAQVEAYLAAQQLEAVLSSTEEWQRSDADSSNPAIRMAKRWVRGERVQWQSLHGELTSGKERHSRLHLPVYPFELTDYCIAYESSSTRYSSVRVQLDDDPSLTTLERVRRFITLFVAKALHAQPESIDPEQEFQHLGVDSIVTVKLMRAIHGELGVKLNGRDLREFGSIESLAIQIEKKMAGAAGGDHECLLNSSNGAGDEAAMLDDLEKFRRGELDLSQIKELLN